MRCENVANKLQQRGEQIANAWQTDCNNVANKLRMRGKRIATTWRTICNNVANIPQMRGEQIATMQHSKNKNHTFVTQKPPFCTPKTILLHGKNHTFVWRICNVQITNTLRTFREYPTNTHEMPNEHSAKYTHSTTKHPRTLRKMSTFNHEIPTNTPPGVGTDSSCPYPCIIKYTYSFHQIHISVSSYTNIHIIKYAFPFLVLWVFTYMRAR